MMFESLGSAIDIVWVVVFNPVTWICCVTVGAIKKPLWVIVAVGVVGNFLSVLGFSYYHGSSNSMAEIINAEWLAFFVPESILAGIVTGSLVFFIFKFHSKNRLTS